MEIKMKTELQIIKADNDRFYILWDSCGEYVDESTIMDFFFENCEIEEEEEMYQFGIIEKDYGVASNYGYSDCMIIGKD
jgi:hypothetical protein